MAPKKNGGYKPTSLPPLLDLSNKNTRHQLDSRYEKPKDAKKESEDACRDVMKDDLIQWIEKDTGKLDLLHVITPQGDVQGFWMWLREFHKEYNDDWYTRNMPRLKEQFEPVFKRTLKALRSEATGKEASTSNPKEPTDLLDLGEQASVPAVVPSPSASNDLIDIGAVSSTAGPPQPAVNNGFDMLLHLDDISSKVAAPLMSPLSAPSSPAAGQNPPPPPPPPPPSSAQAPVKRPETSLLDELGLDFGGGTNTTTNEAPVAAAASASSLNLLDL